MVANEFRDEREAEPRTAGLRRDKGIEQVLGDVGGCAGAAT